MNSSSRRSPQEGMVVCPHPNDVDRKRIERELAKRKRYRYVEPQVEPMTNGYRITSPCCSRNIDPSGGVIDIAWLEYVATNRTWRAHHMDHATKKWVRNWEGARLPELLRHLNEDTNRQFWP